MYQFDLPKINHYDRIRTYTLLVHCLTNYSAIAHKCYQMTAINKYSSYSCYLPRKENPKSAQISPKDLGTQIDQVLLLQNAHAWISLDQYHGCTKTRRGSALINTVDLQWPHTDQPWSIPCLHNAHTQITIDKYYGYLITIQWSAWSIPWLPSDYTWS